MSNSVIGVKRTKYGTAHASKMRAVVMTRGKDVEICESVDHQIAAILDEKRKETLRIERSVAEEVRRRIYEMTDVELVTYLGDLSEERRKARESLLNAWERAFAEGVVTFFQMSRWRALTWKQKKHAREIVEKLEFSRGVGR